MTCGRKEPPSKNRITWGSEEVVGLRYSRRVAGTEELRQGEHQIENSEEDAGKDGRLVLSEPPPHQLPLSGDGEFFFVKLRLRCVYDNLFCHTPPPSDSLDVTVD